MAARRTFARAQVRGQKPGTNWVRTVEPTLVTVAAGAKVLIASFSLDNPGISETVRRSRGRFFVSADTANSEPRLGALGFIVINDVARTLGVTGIPGPVTDASDDDWFVWEPFGLLTGYLEGAVGNTSIGTLNFEFDSKAMRRIADGRGIAVMVENASATTGLRFQCGLSILTSRS